MIEALVSPWVQVTVDVMGAELTDGSYKCTVADMVKLVYKVKNHYGS